VERDLETEIEASGFKYNRKSGSRWRQQPKIELDGEEWSVTCGPQGVTSASASSLLEFVRYINFV